MPPFSEPIAPKLYSYQSDCKVIRFEWNMMDRNDTIDKNRISWGKT